MTIFRWPCFGYRPCRDAPYGATVLTCTCLFACTASYQHQLHLRSGFSALRMRTTNQSTYWSLCILSSRRRRRVGGLCLFVWTRPSNRQTDSHCSFIRDRDVVLSLVAAALNFIMPPPRGIKRRCASDVWRYDDDCLSRTSGLSREQRGLGRLKLAQG